MSFAPALDLDIPAKRTNRELRADPETGVTFGGALGPRHG
jgi:hypothetical protein